MSAIRQPVIPTGAVIDLAGSTVPNGYLLCYGQAISRTTYANLFAVISTAHGAGDGANTFNVPDLRGRAVCGKDNMGGVAAGRISTGTTLGAVDGSESHTLTVDQLPSHTHQYAYLFTGGAGFTWAPNQWGYGWRDSDTTGGDLPHNNTQPSLVVNKLIKT